MSIISSCVVYYLLHLDRINPTSERRLASITVSLALVDEVQKVHSNSSPLAPRSGVFRFFCGSMSFDCLSPSRRGVCIVRAGCPRASKSRVLQVLSASIKLSTSGRLPYVHLGPVQQQLLQNSLCAPAACLPNGRADFDFIIWHCKLPYAMGLSGYQSSNIILQVCNQSSPLEKVRFAHILRVNAELNFNYNIINLLLSILLS
jgi:hypothetical protein